MKRVVTGVDAEGRSCVVSSEELPPDHAGAVWSYAPGDIRAIVAAIPDGVAADLIEPPAGGANLFYATWGPAADGFTLPEMPGMDEEGWHVTRTIDLAYLVSGQLTLLLDTEDVVLEAGDFVVQQATRHAWRNDGDVPASLLGVVLTPSA